MKKTIQHTLVLFLMIGLGALIAILFAMPKSIEEETVPVIKSCKQLRIEFQNVKANVIRLLHQESITGEELKAISELRSCRDGETDLADRMLESKFDSLTYLAQKNEKL